MNTPIAHINGQNKDAQIIEGCKRLQATQTQGQGFSAERIAEACGVHKRAIEFTLRRAFYKVGHALIKNDRQLLEEVIQGKPDKELHTVLAASGLTDTSDATAVRAARGILLLAESNYEVDFPPASKLSQRAASAPSIDSRRFSIMLAKVAAAALPSSGLRWTRL